MWINVDHRGFPMDFHSAARCPKFRPLPGVEQEWSDQPTGGAESSAEVETGS